MVENSTPVDDDYLCRVLHESIWSEYTETPREKCGVSSTMFDDYSVGLIPEVEQPKTETRLEDLEQNIKRTIVVRPKNLTVLADSMHEQPEAAKDTGNELLDKVFEQLAAISDEQASFREQIVQLSKQHASVKDEIGTLAQTLLIVEEDISWLKKQNQELGREVQILRGEIERASIEESHLTIRVGLLEEKVEELLAGRDGTRAEVTELKARLSVVEAESKACKAFREQYLSRVQMTAIISLLDLSRDAAVQAALSPAHRKVYRSWRELKRSKGAAEARRITLDGLHRNHKDHPIPGFATPEDFLEFLETAFGLREVGNLAAHNYRKDKILAALVGLPEEKKGQLAHLVEFLNNMDGWWEGGVVGGFDGEVEVVDGDGLASRDRLVEDVDGIEYDEEEAGGVVVEGYWGC
ncbi:hypothetical protein BJ508DRAFT_303639 [Ascobolus immersus RN42]|uniref:Uncharacterized protein n=1 Tax=Ascobolus immersus RN42 TaxID=1160509 RepID=A0A3N4IK76_ASCIM|nr:hypothetical protein BJ508DRAFT_303639 [Ascobolus immersus RN42]